MGYFTIFGYGLNLAPFLRNPRRHWAAPVALLVHVAQIIAIGWLFGVSKALLAVVLPLALAHAIGAYLFYVQHNFVGMRLQPRAGWDYVRAALESSSMFEMSPLMHWLTGNIGFHHVHHLNHRVPFYKLPQAMQRVPELQRPQTTSWRWHDVAGCLSLMLWDSAQQRMLTRGELARLPRGA
jgi:omega-6 fatty acid desaturase (delta-12 desaturase)